MLWCCGRKLVRVGEAVGRQPAAWVAGPADRVLAWLHSTPLKWSCHNDVGPLPGCGRHCHSPPHK